jgi:hypothetical protein
MGYGRLPASTLSNANEDHLTEVFVKAMRDAAEDPNAPEAVIDLHIHEKQRQNDGTREGNARLELDIVLERTGRGSRPAFAVEAKRLGPAHPVTTYLGEHGLGAFISSEYAVDHEDAGMLGYVQSKTIGEWIGSLAGKLGTAPGDFSVSPDGVWQASPFPHGPASTYRTRHARAGGSQAITIFHTLLDFRASATG